ncbi:MAG: adenylate cyclase [Candidatus Sericytochromatia bacterium]|nr:MAG: adenylate cyclase [Candidatus Sericytochromatia bacterium]
MVKHSLIYNENIFNLNYGNQVLGRTIDNNICINEPSISSKHLLISNFDDKVEIVDLNSSNGTLLNGKRLFPLKSYQIQSGDKLTLGKANILYRINKEENINFDDNYSSISELLKNSKGDVTVLAKFDPKEFNKVTELKENLNVNDMKNLTKRLSFLYSFGQKIGSIFDLKELFKNIIKEIFELFPAADRALVFILSQGEMKPVIFMKEGKEYPISMANYSKTIVSMATNEKHGFIASDLSSGQDIDRSKSIVLLNLQCTMIVPFIVDNELYGLLQLDSTKKINAFNEEDLKMLSGISNQIAINIKNRQLINKISQQEKVKNSLERFLGPKMVEHLIKNNINLEQKGQERNVSILFSDIRGFTPMSEKLKPTQVIEILSTYFSRMTEIIFKYDGFIDKFIGDAIFCIFGIPIEQDNREDLAVKTAIEMQKELSKLNKEVFIKNFGIELSMGIGVNTGNVVYGNIASMERPEVTILGDSVNTAERLCSNAKPKQILVSENVINNLKEKYNFEKIGPLKLKGKQNEVNVFSILY